MSLVSGLLNQTADIYNATLNEWGDVTATLVTANVPCRFEESIGKVVGPDATVKEYYVNMWILPGQEIKYDYEVRKDGEVYKVVGIEKRKGLGGEHDHTRLYLA